MILPDLFCVALIAVTLSLDHLLLWRWFLQRSRVDSGRARFWLYSAWTVEEWTLAASVVALWLYKGRAWRALRLTAPDGWRLWASMSLVLALAITLAAATLKVARIKRKKRVKVQGHVEGLAPHTRSELGLWAVLSVSAGFSEELIFRGYLIWAFQPALGLWGAAALSVAGFAVAHGYQGKKGVLATGIVGCLLTLLVVVFGSLWPAVVIHALVDLQQGLVAWLVLGKVHEGEALTNPPA